MVLPSYNSADTSVSIQLLLVALLGLSIYSLAQRFIAWRRLSHIRGSPARVGLNTVVNSNPESVVRVLQPRSGFIGALDYQAARFRPGSDNILSMRDKKAHKVLKSKTTAGVASLSSVIRKPANLSLQYNGKDVEGQEGQKGVKTFAVRLY
ncbi:Cytochrome P450 [Penicillium cf. griseofulvum]|uniref:Cytochrome P450 n=1 Tax=Penicillium cf. griseofulvum TaxID=2972120 RepID=A0A9W9IV84_9EURO|nr:Cytochrome P450 [Penicillium cf. griseofulvum]